MLVPETLKAKPSDNYDDLKRQFFALRNLCESKIKECSIYSNRLAEYDRQSLIARNEALESEREMNAQLTNELEAANERIREIEKHLSDFNEQTSKIAEKLGEERGKSASLQGELSRTKSNMKSLAKELQESDDELRETQKRLSEKNSLDKVMIKTLIELRERMRKGGRVERSDLPKDMLILEECVNLHPAEYAVRYELMQREMKMLEIYVDKVNLLLEEVRESGDFGSHIDEKISALLRGDSLKLSKETNNE